jgi:hypothetical protein
MRFMIMHKVDARMEAGAPPREGVVQAMGQLIGRCLKEGIFLDGAGLHRGVTRARVAIGAGVTRGLTSGSNELVAGFAHVIAKSLDDAIELATRLGEAAGDREVEVGPVVEPWDLTGKPRPDGAPHRFLLLRKAEAAFEAGAPMPAAAREILDTWKRDGILQSESTLAPSATGKRSRPSTGKRTWTDGPFTESKELIGGFSIIDVPSIDDAVRFSDEYGAILFESEIDIRGVA